LLEQAVQTKQAGAKHVFVYRNIVKALPWFRSVREKLNDPAYEGFFLSFSNTTMNNDYHVPACARENKTFCSHLYHDQEQTPQVPTSNDPHPDGSCVGYCDCGEHHPCGEYLFDHRNGTMLREFLVDEIILGALKHGVIDGFFLDDFWCSDLICQATDNATAGCPCSDPVQGPTEIDSFSQQDMGLSDEDIRDITVEWNQTMTVIHRVLLQHNAYTWSLIPGQENADASPLLLSSNQSECIQLLRSACHQDSLWQSSTLLFGFTVHNGTILSQLEQDLAFFLLVRGPYAFAGWGVWGMTWPFNAEPSHGALPPMPHGVPLPGAFFMDYGEPVGICLETPSGIFTRQWSRASVQLDCNSFQANTSLTEEKLTA
jgi:hypothetical protein